MTECLRTIRYFTQLRSTDARKGLAWRVADNHIKSRLGRTQAERFCELSWRGSSDISRLSVSCVSRMEIGAMRTSSLGVALDCRRNIATLAWNPSEQPPQLAKRSSTRREGQIRG